jgi:peptide chain release factor 1
MEETLRILSDEIAKIDSKIKENQDLLLDPEFKSLELEIKGEIESLEATKTSIQNSINEIQNSGKSSEDSSGFEINPNVAIMEVRAGTGGSEAALFAFDLYRMYQRYCEKKRYKTTEEFYSEESAGGIKTVIFEIKGPDVYNLFKNESKLYFRNTPIHNNISSNFTSKHN